RPRGGALRAAGAHLQGAAYGRAEARQVRREDVVRGAGLDACGRRFLVDTARHDDQGDERGLVLEDLQGFHSAEPRNRVVGQYDVGGEITQLAAEVLVAIDAACAALD